MTEHQSDDELLKELAGAYRTAKMGGRFLVAVLLGILGFIVLFSQAWEIIKTKFGLH
jgi:hypothetical protein